MKARADDRRLFENELVLNVMALQDSHGLDDETMAQTVFDAAIALEGGEALPSGQLFGGGQLETQHSSGLSVNDLRVDSVFCACQDFRFTVEGACIACSQAR
jgi:hypothetical protein